MAHIKAMHREEDKSDREGAWFSIIIYFPAFELSQRSCLTLSNPLTVRASNPKAGLNVSNGQGEYSCELYDIHGTDLERLKQQQRGSESIHEKRRRKPMEFHERPSRKSNR
jgi:hypothetical protein